MPKLIQTALFVCNIVAVFGVQSCLSVQEIFQNGKCCAASEVLGTTFIDDVTCTSSSRGTYFKSNAWAAARSAHPLTAEEQTAFDAVKDQTFKLGLIAYSTAFQMVAADLDTFPPQKIAGYGPDFANALSTLTGAKVDIQWGYDSSPGVFTGVGNDGRPKFDFHLGWVGKPNRYELATVDGFQYYVPTEIFSTAPYILQYKSTPEIESIVSAALTNTSIVDTEGNALEPMWRAITALIAAGKTMVTCECNKLDDTISKKLVGWDRADHVIMGSPFPSKAWYGNTPDQAIGKAIENAAWLDVIVGNNAEAVERGVTADFAIFDDSPKTRREAADRGLSTAETAVWQNQDVWCVYVSPGVDASDPRREMGKHLTTVFKYLQRTGISEFIFGRWGEADIALTKLLPAHIAANPWLNASEALKPSFGAAYKGWGVWDSTKMMFGQWVPATMGLTAPVDKYPLVHECGLLEYMGYPAGSTPCEVS